MLHEIGHLLADPAHWVGHVVMDVAYTAVVLWPLQSWWHKRHDRRTHGKRSSPPA